MKSKRILDALGQVEEQYVAEAAPARKKLPRWGRALTLAACLCLVVLSGAEIIDRYEWFRAGCSASPGTIVGDTYYFSEKGSGIYSYAPGEGTKKELSTFWYEGWLVNDYGIYYKQGHSVYVQIHESGRRIRLYTASWFKYTHIGFSLDADGSVIVTQYNKHREVEDEVRIDGVTGAYIETVTPSVSYDDVWGDLVIPYSRANFTLGDRTLTLTPIGKENRFHLYENGENILPEGLTVDNYNQYGDNIWFDISLWDGSTHTCYVATPSGEDQIVTLPSHYYDTGTGDYLFYSDEALNEDYSSEWTVWCLDWHTGESWPLEFDWDGADFYSLVTDGEWFYSCAPWSDAQTCWRLVYEAGRPAALALVSENVAPHGH